MGASGGGRGLQCGAVAVLDHPAVVDVLHRGQCIVADPGGLAGQDLAALNDLLPGLGLEGTSPGALAALCRDGFAG